MTADQLTASTNNKQKHKRIDFYDVGDVIKIGDIATIEIVDIVGQRARLFLETSVENAVDKFGVTAIVRPGEYAEKQSNVVDTTDMKNASTDKSAGVNNQGFDDEMREEQEGQNNKNKLNKPELKAIKRTDRCLFRREGSINKAPADLSGEQISQAIGRALDHVWCAG